MRAKIIGLIILILSLCLIISSYAQSKPVKLQGFVGKGGLSVRTSSTVSYEVQQSYSNATVTVYKKGTLTLASIYSDDSRSVKANPFTADSSAFYYFYGEPGDRYDIKFSKDSITLYTLSDVSFGMILSTRVVYASSLGAALDSNLTTGGGTDDTATIQAALSTALIGPIDLIIDGPALTTGLNIYSNTIVESINGGGLFLKTGSNRSTIENVNRTSGAIQDKSITIRNITINSNTDGQSKYEGNGVVPVAPMNVAIQLFGIDGLNIENVKSIDSRGYNIHIANAFNVWMNGNSIIYTGSAISNHDGIHVNGPADNININNTLIKGTTDDGIAISPDDDHNSMGGLGLVAFGTIGNVSITNTVFDHAFFGIRVLSNTNRLNNLYIQNVTGTIQEYTLRLDDYSYILGSGVGNIGNVTLDGMNIQGFSTNPQGYGEAIRIEANIQNIVFKNIVQGAGWFADYRPIVRVLSPTANTGHGDIKQLDLDYTVNDPVGTVIPISGTNRGNRLQIEGNVEVCNLHSNHYRDPSVLKATGAVQLNNSIDCNKGIGVLNISGTLVNQFNAIAITAGKINNINLNGLVDKDDGGALLFDQAFACISTHPTVNGSANIIGSGAFLGGTNSNLVTLGTISLNSNSRIAGDLQVLTQTKGVILRATDGTTCYRVTVNNIGTLSTTSVTCPQ